MPPRIFRDVLAIDRSALARNMYQLLFAGQSRYRVLFADEYESLFKRSERFRPDVLIVNSNALGPDAEVKFPCPTLLLISKNRVDLKEKAVGHEDDVVVIEKPFYPYDLLAVANRLIFQAKQRKKRRRGRGPGRRPGRKKKVG